MTYYADPRNKTMDELWEAAEAACQWRSIYLSFTGLQANITGKGGWNAMTWGGDNIPDMGQEQVYAPMGRAAAWGWKPRSALMDLISRLETEPRQPREPLWFEHE